MLQREFPRMQFSGGVFNPGDLRVAAAQLMQMSFFGGLGLLTLGKGLLPERWQEALAQNQLAAFGGLFVMNMLAGQLVNTGAFEISYDGTPVWSKLETGRFPQPAELIEAVRATCTA